MTNQEYWDLKRILDEHEYEGFPSSSNPIESAVIPAVVDSLLDVINELSKFPEIEIPSLQHHAFSSIHAKVDNVRLLLIWLCWYLDSKKRLQEVL